MLVADHYPKLEYGDKIRVSGKLELPKNFENENGNEFDYVSYLSKDKIHFLIYRPEVEKIGSGESNKIIASLYSFKNVFIENTKNEIISKKLAEKFIGVVGLRNILVHEYADIDYKLAYSNLDEKLNDLKQFAKEVLEFLEKQN